MKRTHYAPAAVADIDDIAERIATDNLDAAIRFCLAVEEAAEKLASMPGMGQQREFANPSLIALRSWSIKGFRKYLIFYRGTGYGIEVVRIIHGAQDIETLFSADP